MRPLLALFGLLALACGRPEPVKTPRGYEIAYCLEASQCYQDASKVCPNGYSVVDWDGAHPKVVVCD